MPVPTRTPPGPPGTFLRGNLPDFQRDRLNFFSKCARDYGDVFRLRFGYRNVIVFCHPDHIEQILVTDYHNFRKHFALRINPLVLGNGLLSSEGEFWLRQRRLVQPVFLRQRITNYGRLIVEYTERTLASWRDGQQCDILKEMMKLTLSIIAKTLFDADIEGQSHAVGEALEVTQQSFIERVSMLVPLPLWLPTPGNLRLKRAVRKLDAILYGIIVQRRQSGEDKGDLLSLLLHAHDEGDRSGMTDKQLRDEAMTLFLAGHETTALTLSWTWFLLAGNPDAAAKLHAEVDTLLGDRLPNESDWPRLSYTEKVIMEGMRLYPPGYVIGREALQECTVGGYAIHKGDTVLMPQWVVHRDPRWFPNPENFLPERWESQRARLLPKFAYFPFGGGPRQCIGNTFAMMEAVLVLATIARRFDFTVVPDHPVIAWPTFTLRPRHGIQVVLKRRL